MGSGDQTQVYEPSLLSHCPHFINKAAEIQISDLSCLGSHNLARRKKNKNHTECGTELHTVRTDQSQRLVTPMVESPAREVEVATPREPKAPRTTVPKVPLS